VTMTLNWGYLIGTAIFLGVLVVLVAAQIFAKRFHPFLYWSTIVASTTFGTTLAGFADRLLGIGHTGGSSLLLALLLNTIGPKRRQNGDCLPRQLASPTAALRECALLRSAQNCTCKVAVSKSCEV